MAQSATTESRRPPRALFRLLNPLFALILRSPLHGLLSKRLMLLTYIGRMSGKRYTIPVGYAQTGDTLLVATQSGWKVNLRDGARVRLRLRGRDLAGATERIDDEAGLIEHYRAMLPLAPQISQAIGVRVEPDGGPNRDDVARARREGHVGIRIRLDHT